MNRAGKQCQGLLGHGGVHEAEQDAVRYVWTDESSPTSVLDLVVR